MRGLCIELLHYITEAIDNNESDDEINSRIEIVANREDITSEEYCQIPHGLDGLSIFHWANHKSYLPNNSLEYK